MKKIAVIYWSGTGNTEAMANAVADGAKKEDTEVKLMTCGDFTSDMVPDFNTFAFGCSANGAEELEADEFQPMWDSVKGLVAGSKVALFGSYGWGGGDYLDTWKDDCGDMTVVGTCTCDGAPEDDILDSCKALGALLTV